MLERMFPVERTIYRNLNSLADKLYGEDKLNSEWTDEFKKKLFELGTQRDYYVCATLKQPEERSEWLWDVCWLDYDRERMDFRGVFLACEIEWDMGERSRLDDFWKLTVALADFRLFICTVPGETEKQQEVFEKLMDSCPGSRGARYLVIGVPNTRKAQLDLPWRAWTL